MLAGAAFQGGSSTEKGLVTHVPWPPAAALSCPAETGFRLQETLGSQGLAWARIQES